jgi:hypothetical protein
VTPGMTFTVRFEQWFLDDGLYPPLSVGERINVAIQLMPRVCEADPLAKVEWQPDPSGTCAFSGKVIAVVRGEPTECVAAINVGPLAFYIEGTGICRWDAGTTVSGQGTLILDYGAWNDAAIRMSGAPDLYRTMIIVGLRRAKASAFVRATGDGRLVERRPRYLDAVAVPSMEGATGDDLFLMDLEIDNEVAVPKTFRLAPG